MANPKQSLMMLAGLGIVLLVLMVTMGVIILVGANFKEQICEQEGGTYTTTCSSLGEGYNATVDLQSEIIGLISWVGLMVLGAIAVVLIGMARSFGGGEKGY